MGCDNEKEAAVTVQIYQVFIYALLELMYDAEITRMVNCHNWTRRLTP